VPNLAGLSRAIEAKVDEVAIFAAASETFSRRNINQTIAESLDGYRAVCERAREAHLPVRAYVSTAFGCPFEGAIDPSAVRDVSAALINMGAYEVAVSDTIGIAHPGQVASVIDEVTKRVPLERVALHFHDTRGTALANVLMALQLGIAAFDASAGGLGGCPYAPGATGNLAPKICSTCSTAWGSKPACGSSRSLRHPSSWKARSATPSPRGMPPPTRRLIVKGVGRVFRRAFGCFQTGATERGGRGSNPRTCSGPSSSPRDPPGRRQSGRARSSSR
jgi:hypothetical protein